MLDTSTGYLFASDPDPVHTSPGEILPAAERFECTPKQLGLSHNYQNVIVFKNLRFQYVFRPHYDAKPAFQISSVCFRFVFVSTAHAQVDTKTEKKFVNLSICNRYSISDLLCRGESVRLIPTNHMWKSKSDPRSVTLARRTRALEQAFCKLLPSTSIDRVFLNPCVFSRRCTVFWQARVFISPCLFLTRSIVSSASFSIDQSMRVFDKVHLSIL